MSTQQFANSILEMQRALSAYARVYRREFNEPVGNDSVLGPCWAEIASGLRGLLNGPTADLDCGRVDSTICETAKLNEVNLE